MNPYASYSLKKASLYVSMLKKKLLCRRASEQSQRMSVQENCLELLTTISVQDSRSEENRQLCPCSTVPTCLALKRGSFPAGIIQQLPATRVTFPSTELHLPQRRHIAGLPALRPVPSGSRLSSSSDTWLRGAQML